MPRTKGTPNRITASTKELLNEVIGGEADRIQEALSEVFESNKKDYLLIMARLLPYVIPKATEVPTNEPAERKSLSWFSNRSLSSEDLPFNHHETALPFITSKWTFC